MPRKPTFSPSRFSIYLACPVKYRWTYLDPRGKWFMTSKPYYSFGTTLHKVLQKFHESGGAEVTSVETAVDELDASWIEAGYESEEVSFAYREQGREMIRNYVELQKVEGKSSKLVFVEKQFRKDLGNFVLLGRIDRLDEHADGMLEIIDYKSERQNVSVDEVQSNLAMSIYQLLIREHFPNKEVIASIIGLKDGSSASASLTQSELKHFEEDLIELGNEILNTSFEEITPSYKHICSYCDFPKLCKNDPEFKSALESAATDD